MKISQVGPVVMALILALIPSSIAAEEGGDEEPTKTSETYGIYYGDGLRHLAEDQHLAAVTSLFRAYGLQPSAHVMGLIVEAYDSMGHCSAARRQISYFAEHHDGAESPELDRCTSTGELTIDCEAATETIRLNDSRDIRCGQVLELPTDSEHRLVWGNGSMTERVNLGQGEEQIVELTVPERSEHRPEVARLPTLSNRVARLPLYPRIQALRPTEQPDIPRLTSPSAVYRVYESTDGIYHVWVRSDESGSDGGDPRVELICPTDAPASDEDDDCIWLRER